MREHAAQTKDEARSAQNGFSVSLRSNNVAKHCMMNTLMHPSRQLCLSSHHKHPASKRRTHPYRHFSPPVTVEISHVFSLVASFFFFDYSYSVAAFSDRYRL